MAFAIEGFDANGRVIQKGVNVVIPPQSAGIGDLILKSGSTFKVIGRGTASGTSISIDGATYNIYGIIYSFTAGMAMVIAPKELGGKAWGAYDGAMPIISSGKVLMRNGQNASYYAQMNTARNSAYISQGSGYPDVLGSAYQACGSQGGYPGKASKGSWWEYIRQTLRVQGAPDSPFGAVTTNVKVHEFGRWMGKTFGEAQAAGTAMKECFAYGEGNGTWWLPSMFELGELMIDEHLDKVNENSGVDGIDGVSAGSGRWSCVLLSDADAWYYYYSGVSDYWLGFSDVLAVRPVTLLKL